MALPYALVVEDDPLVAELFQRALQDAGYQADVLENGHRAQAQLVFTTPDLIVIDLLMPTMSGGVLLRQIRGQQRLWHTRVIIATGDVRLPKTCAPWPIRSSLSRSVTSSCAAWPSNSSRPHKDLYDS
ncbi:MAG: response regulator [Anaerolineales bacterium]